MFCSKCGNELPDGALFCAKCGNDVGCHEVKESEQNVAYIETPTEGRNRSNSNETQSDIKLTNEKKTKKKKWLWIVVIFVVIIVLLNTCGGGSEDDGATISVDDIKVDYTALSDNTGTDVPVIVNQVSYAEAFYVGFTDITLDISNTTENDYRDMKFVALAWDKDGYPIKFKGTDDPYPYLMNCNNLGPNATEQRNWEYADYFEIRYISVFLAECTDFEGNTWVNPAMDYIDEHKGEKLETTQLSYYSFE